MSYREEPTFTIGAVAVEGDIWKIERGATAIITFDINVPDTGAPIITSTMVDRALLQIREQRGDDTPKLRAGTGMGELYMTMTRPTPQKIKIVVTFPHNITFTDLDLKGENIAATDLRRNTIPGRGFTDLLLILANGQRHFVWAAQVSATLMITQEDDA